MRYDPIVLHKLDLSFYGFFFSFIFIFGSKGENICTWRVASWLALNSSRGMRLGYSTIGLSCVLSTFNQSLFGNVLVHEKCQLYHSWLKNLQKKNHVWMLAMETKKGLSYANFVVFYPCEGFLHLKLLRARKI